MMSPATSRTERLELCSVAVTEVGSGLHTGGMTLLLIFIAFALAQISTVFAWILNGKLEARRSQVTELQQRGAWRRQAILDAGSTFSMEMAIFLSAFLHMSVARTEDRPDDAAAFERDANAATFRSRQAADVLLMLGAERTGRLGVQLMDGMADLLVSDQGGRNAGPLIEEIDAWRQRAAEFAVSVRRELPVPSDGAPYRMSAASQPA